MKRVKRSNSETDFIIIKKDIDFLNHKIENINNKENNILRSEKKSTERKSKYLNKMKLWRIY